MHILKVAFLLVLTLMVMRAVSWLLGWVAFRIGKASRMSSKLAGNVVALGLFVGFLAWNQMPGEPFDVAATVFGAVVFGIYQLIDLKWCPWDRAPGGK